MSGWLADGYGHPFFNKLMASAGSAIFLFLSAICPFGSCPGQSNGDLFYIPAKSSRPLPALIILSCTGAIQTDLDSCKPIADSLGWALATCAKSRNHRDSRLNDYDIMATYSALLAKHEIDRERVFLYGFSGQGVQALMSVFLHPEAFRGALSVCGHDGAMGMARPEVLGGKLFYLVTRKKDWNRAANIRMAAALTRAGARDTLIVTEGKHEPKGYREIFQGCRWLNKNAR